MWGPWIEHDGKGLPDHVRGQPVMLKWSDGKTSISVGGCRGGLSWDWRNAGMICGNGGLICLILRYRLRRSPDADSLIETIRDLPQPVGEDA